MITRAHSSLNMNPDFFRTRLHDSTIRPLTPELNPSNPPLTAKTTFVFALSFFRTRRFANLISSEIDRPAPSGSSANSAKPGRTFTDPVPDPSTATDGNAPSLKNSKTWMREPEGAALMTRPWNLGFGSANLEELWMLRAVVKM